MPPEVPFPVCHRFFLVANVLRPRAIAPLHPSSIEIEDKDDILLIMDTVDEDAGKDRSKEAKLLLPVSLGKLVIALVF